MNTNGLTGLMDQKLFNDLSTIATIKTFEPETVLMNEGDHIRNIPIVLKGSIRILQQDEDGKEILLYYIKPGESCIMSFLGAMHQGESKVKAVVEERAEVMLIPVNLSHDLITKYPAWVDFIFKLYNKRFEELLSVVNAIAFQKVDQRIVELLQKKYQLTGSKEITITHQQMADELGTAREVVSRLLKQLEKEKRISLGRNKITLLNVV